MNPLELALNQPPPPSFYLSQNGEYLLVNSPAKISQAMAFLQTPTQSVVECAKNFASQAHIGVFDKLPKGIYPVPDVCLPQGPEVPIIIGLGIVTFAIIAAYGVHRLTRPSRRPASNVIIVQGDDLGKWLERVNAELNSRKTLAGNLFRKAMVRLNKNPDSIID